MCCCAPGVPPSQKRGEGRRKAPISWLREFWWGGGGGGGGGGATRKKPGVCLPQGKEVYLDILGARGGGGGKRGGGRKRAAEGSFPPPTESPPLKKTVAKKCHLWFSFSFLPPPRWLRRGEVAKVLFSSFAVSSPFLPPFCSSHSTLSSDQ